MTPLKTVTFGLVDWCQRKMHTHTHVDTHTHTHAILPQCHPHAGPMMNGSDHHKRRMSSRTERERVAKKTLLTGKTKGTMREGWRLAEAVQRKHFWRRDNKWRMVTFRGEVRECREGSGVSEEEDGWWTARIRKTNGGRTHESASNVWFVRHLIMKQKSLFWLTAAVLHMWMVFKIPFHVQMMRLGECWGSTCFSLQLSFSHHVRQPVTTQQLHMSAALSVDT